MSQVGLGCVAEPWRSGMVCRFWPRHPPVYGVKTSLPPAVRLLVQRGGTTRIISKTLRHQLGGTMGRGWPVDMSCTHD